MFEFQCAYNKKCVLVRVSAIESIEDINIGGGYSGVRLTLNSGKSLDVLGKYETIIESLKGYLGTLASFDKEGEVTDLCATPTST